MKSPAEISPAPVSKAARWTGYVISVVPVFMLIMSGISKITQSPEVVKGFASWPTGVAVPIGIAELVCTVIYLIPRTSVLGTILLTGYLGGATATVVQAGMFSMLAVPVVFGVLLWGSLWLRDLRLRALIPFKK